jgi:hypothetical protein
MRKTKIRMTMDSGNVFADLGLPNPEQYAERQAGGKR